MAKINLYYHKQTDSWWVDSNIDGFTLRNYIKEHSFGLGTIEMNSDNRLNIDGLYFIDSVFIPDYIKKLYGITEEIKENGLENAIQISQDQLSKILE